MVSQLTYFIDLADLSIEFEHCGYFDKYYKDLKENEKAKMPEEDLNEIAQITRTNITYGRYFLPFKMCFITLKSFKVQMFSILQSLFKCYRMSAMPRFPARDENQPTFEQCLNKIMYGIPSPPKKSFSYMDGVLKDLHGWTAQQQPVIEVQMFEKDDKDKLYFQNEN